jgi:hypothetical protein
MLLLLRLCVLNSGVHATEKTTLCCVQMITDHDTQPSSVQHSFANYLLMKALAEKGVSLNFITSPYVQAYVAEMSSVKCRAPSHCQLISALDEMKISIEHKKRQLLGFGQLQS